MPPPTLIDRRRHSRLLAELGPVAVYLDNRSTPLYFKAQDISAGGVFLQTGAIALPLNGVVGLSFPIGGGAQRVLALVRRRTARGAGLAFVNSRAEMAHIRERLPQRRAQPPVRALRSAESPR
jgi:hypothetical protein